ARSPHAPAARQQHPRALYARCIMTNATRRIRPPLKWHGGKHYLVDLILSLMPRHRNYVEPFAGALQVLFARHPDDRRLWVAATPDPRGVNEVATALTADVVTLYRVIRSGQDFPRSRELVDWTPFARLAWQEARERLKRPPGDQDPVERAADF